MFSATVNYLFFILFSFSRLLGKYFYVEKQFITFHKIFLKM